MSQVIPLRSRSRHGADSSGYIPWEDFRLFYEVHGPQTGQPVLLVHGLLLESSCNRDLAQTLAGEGYRVILLDLLGHGRSDRPRHAKWLRIDLFGEQMRCCLDTLHVDKAIVGGVSLGAISALHLAVAHPERVQALLLEMPVMERATPAAAMMLVPLLGATRFAAPVMRALAGLASRLPEPRHNLLQTLHRAVSQQPEDIAAVLHGVLIGPVVPPRRERQTIPVPTLIIGHGGDWLHNLEDARVLAKEMPHARFIVAKSMLELRRSPGRLMPKILRFLESAAASQAA